jgi:protoporphyrin/coproporphyrin ferrochelatase
MARVAVVLFNLGGPDKPQSVQPFLFNLFNDGAIIDQPAIIRWCLAQLISRRRAPIAREIYHHLGGKSPLRELTTKQAEALQQELSDLDEVEVFVCMRYWHPMSDEVARSVQAYDPDHIVLLPLYPQYSTTTTGSSFTDWRRAAAKIGLRRRTHAVCCYPIDDGWISAQSQLLGDTLTSLDPEMPLRVLFSAHGLPKKVIARGDPYQWQVEQTAQAVAAALDIRDDPNNGTAKKQIDWVVCYQSRVGPLEWIGPSVLDELSRAAIEQVGVVIVPIAFVSEHSETLVELDIEYREEAERLGVLNYTRVPAVGTAPKFINGLAGLVRHALGQSENLSCGEGDGARICPAQHGECPLSIVVSP